MTAKEIRTKYKDLHDNLSDTYYKKHELTKEEFDIRHGQIWGDMEAELIAGGYLTLPEPERDLAAEIDDLKAELSAMKK